MTHVVLRVGVGIVVVWFGSASGQGATGEGPTFIERGLRGGVVQAEVEQDPLAALREIERRVRAVVAAAGPATVALDLGFGTGSGVVVDEQGTILTAAHVIGDPGRLVQVRFPDGTVATARTLGSDRQTDAGMARLQGEGPWPWVPRAGEGEVDVHGDAPADEDARGSDPRAPGGGEAGDLAGGVTPGDWVVALGHPAGFEIERPVTARLGRVVRVRSGLGVQSDCVLIGGDSGGPLLNLDGQVVGIHSRIGPSARTNIHVGMDVFNTAWDRLADGQRWGQRRTPLLGVVLVRVDVIQALRATGQAHHEGDLPDGVAVARVLHDSAADDAGLRVGDIITAIDGRRVGNEATVYETMAMQEPGDTVVLSIWRDGRMRNISVALGERS